MTPEDEIIIGNHDSCRNCTGLRALPCFPILNSSGCLSRPAPISEHALRPILVEFECCVSRQTRTGNLMGGVTSL